MDNKIYIPKPKALAVFGGLGDSSPGFVVLILPAVIMTVGLWGWYLFSLAIIIVGIIMINRIFPKDSALIEDVFSLLNDGTNL